MKKLFILFVSVFVFAACATATIDNMGLVTNPKLNNAQKVFVALPQDGVYHNIKYAYSGQQVQQAFFETLSQYSMEVVMAESFQSIEDAKKQAQKVQAQILIYPIITHWEDRNTPWSGLRDKVRLNVQVYSVVDNKLIDKSSLYATNRWLTFVNAAPANLLKRIVPPYVGNLYQ